MTWIMLVSTRFNQCSELRSKSIDISMKGKVNQFLIWQKTRILHTPEVQVLTAYSLDLSEKTPPPDRICNERQQRFLANLPDADPV